MALGGGVLKGLFGTGGARRPDGRWQVEGLGPVALSDLRHAARDERRAIDRFLLSSDAAVHRNRAQLSAMPLPEGTDWRWRPPLFSAPLDPPARVAPPNGEGLGDSAQVFHDCDLRAMVLRQVPNRRATDLARYALGLEVLGFAGGFLSIAIPLPADALAGLDRGHVIQLDTQIEVERPVEIFARLNIVNGPNTDRVQAHLAWMQPGQVNVHVSGFDLAETEISAERIESAWLDLILDGPAMNMVVIRDMVLSRHRRAEI